MSTEAEDRKGEILTLKWGTLKGWKNITSSISRDLIQKYLDYPTSQSVMLQADTNEQKKILIELIQGFEGRIRNDWGGEDMSHEGALEYVTNYGQGELVQPKI